MPPPCSSESKWTGQQPLCHQRKDKLAEPAFGWRGAGESGLALLAIFAQGGIKCRLLRRERDRQFNRGKLFGEGRSQRSLVDVVLEASNADFGQVAFVRRIHLDR